MVGNVTQALGLLTAFDRMIEAAERNGSLDPVTATLLTGRTELIRQEITEG